MGTISGGGNHVGSAGDTGEIFASWLSQLRSYNNNNNNNNKELQHSTLTGSGLKVCVVWMVMV